MNDWKGPYLRYKVDEKNPGIRRGTLSQSPDIIPNGTANKEKPEEFIGDTLWKRDIGISTTASIPNYLYIRGANSSSQAMEAKVYLYFSPASLLQWPRSVDGKEGWADRPLQTGGGRDYQELEVEGNTGPHHGRFVTPSPFIWRPESLPNDHYCLVGRVSTENHPNPIPDGLNKIKDFAKYISEHPDLAWRNVYTTVPDYDFCTESPTYVHGNQDALVGFTVWVTGGQQDDMLTMRASVAGPNPPVSETLSLRGPERDSLSKVTMVPAGYKSTIDVTYIAAKGRKVPKDLEITVAPNLSGIPADSELARYARPLHALGVTKVDDPSMLAIPLGATHYRREFPVF